MFKDRHETPEEIPTCPPDARAAIAHMEEMMAWPEYNHAGVPTHLAVKMLQAGTARSFTEIEIWMRELGSRVYFIGVPLDHFGAALLGKTKSPIEGSFEPEHTLWVGVNGSDEANAQLESIGVTPQQNLINLATTGILTA